jgi:hypothetical protein
MEAFERARRQHRRERLVRNVLIALVVFAFVWFVFLRTQTPTEFDGIPVTQFSTAGVNRHSSGTVQYETSPPVSGEHAPGSPPCGLYSQAIPNESQVHMLEHGGVGVQFLPTLAPEEIEKIQSLVGEYNDNVFSAPYPDMETPIAVTSWSRKMTMDQVNEVAIRGFIDAFAGEGPEPGQTCAGESDSPFEPGASPLPSATAAPTDGDGDGKGKGKKGDG